MRAKRVSHEESSEEEFEEEYVETPAEEEEVKMVERQVMKDEVVEKFIPQVRSLYAYQGQGMGMEKGEVSLCFTLLYYCL